jgi:hypothetical protein
MGVGSMTEPDPSAELARRADEVNVAYERNAAFRAAVLLIPGIGSSLDVLFASEGQRIFRERIHKLIDDMRNDMQALMETVADSTLDKGYLESDEFFDLMMRALDATIRTRDEGKRRLYARILTESTIRSKREGHSPEEYLDLIADLTPRELYVARMLYTDWAGEGYVNREHIEVEEAWRGWRAKVRAEVGIDGADLQLILGRLRSAGLITESIADFPIGGGPPASLPLYWVSSPFEKLMRFLERRE